MVAFTKFALTALALALGGLVDARKVACGVAPSRHSGDLIVAKASGAATKPSATAAAASVFKPGVQWEICIHHPVKHDSVNDFIPSKAAVWDIDLSHAKEFPNMIPMLKVSVISPRMKTNC